MIGSDVVRGMIKLYLNGYLSYDEIVGWAMSKYNNSEFVADVGDEHSGSMFDVLSLIMESQAGGQCLDVNDFESFLDRLNTGNKLSI
jgi:hypothetical protein